MKISQLRVEWAPYRRRSDDRYLERSGYRASSGSILVSQSGLKIIEPSMSALRDFEYGITVDPADIDGLIEALKQAKDLGRQLFNRA